MNKARLPTLALIAGPTASGKSALAMALARTRPSVIVNADSMQVYRDLRVVTARPSEADEAEVPHALFGHVDAADVGDAARWASEARAVIDAAHAAGQLPILVGGTGLYIRILLDGIAPVPAIDPAIRAEARAMAVADAHAALMIADPAAAARLAPADTTRIARALEVVRSTGRPLAEWQAERVGGIGERVHLAPIVLTPPRDWLDERIAARFETIFAEGQNEVRGLVARALDPALPAMRAIGVAQIADFQTTKVTETCAKNAAVLASRQYAKRQATWFERQAPANWPRHREQLTCVSDSDRVIKLLFNSLTR